MLGIEANEFKFLRLPSTKSFMSAAESVNPLSDWLVLTVSDILLFQRLTGGAVDAMKAGKRSGCGKLSKFHA